MLARLFLVLLLALSLSNVRGWTTTLETASAVELVVVDTEPAVSDGDATVGRDPQPARPRSTESAGALTITETAATSPDLGRVFRPPRMLGS